MLTEDNFEIELNNKENSNDKNSFGLITNSDDYKNNNNKGEDNNNYINISDSLKLFQLQNKIINNSLLGSEEIFINQKKEIETIKQKNQVLNLQKESKSNALLHKINKNYINIDSHINGNVEQLKENNCNNADVCNDEIYTLNDYKNFEYSIINTENENGEDISDIIDINNVEWKTLNEDFPFSYEVDNILKKAYNFIEINKLALRVIQDIDFYERGVELNINVNLIEESELWIFTRCYVNKGINESNCFDDKSNNIDSTDIFNKYTSFIRIIKEIRSNRCFITFGTFYNENDKLYYKSFLKRHLIDYSEKNKYNRSKSEINIIIVDNGEEVINTQVFLNNNLQPNITNGKLFLPINKKAKIVICGHGKSVQLKDLTIKTYDKRKSLLLDNIKFEENEAHKNCECCTIL